MMNFDPKALVTSLTEMTAALREGGEGPATVVQIQSGALQVKVAVGVSDYDTNTPAGVNQTFEIGSQTKMMTSVMILQLMEEGLVDLDAAAADYLPPEVVAGLTNADTATVRQLLNMTAGIANYTDAVNADGLPSFIAYLLEHPDSVFGPDQALEIARGMDPTGAPGESYYYSNTNYALLGMIIEGLTGQSFIQALQERVFDPAGMTASVRQLNADDPRLHSYETNPVTDELMDVTGALWEMHGEAGVASTTRDMVAFLQALMVDKTLLGPAALAEMTDVTPSQSAPGFSTGFGLGLLQASFDGAGSFVGFAGGTLATESSTFLNLDTGMITAIGSTTDLAASQFAGLELSLAAADQALWTPVQDDGGAVQVVSGSAAEMRLTEGAGGLRLGMGGASLTLDRDLGALTTSSLIFADGSVLVVGNDAAGLRGDARGNEWRIARDFAAAMEEDNHLMGLGGADTLHGGNGDDWLQGGAGRDVLQGGAGDDVLQGGGGADLFVFDLTDHGRDVIRDFAVGQDHIDLSALSDVQVALRHGHTVITAGDLTIVLPGVGHLDADSLIL